MYFQNSKLGNWKDDPDEWITELERKRVYLRDMEVIISDEDFILHIISNLPEECDNVIERIEDDFDQIEIEELREKLNVKYEKIMLRKGFHKNLTGRLMAKKLRCLQLVVKKKE